MSPRISMPSTESGVPVSGTGEVTFVIFFTGVISTFGGFVLLTKGSRIKV